MDLVSIDNSTPDQLLNYKALDLTQGTHRVIILIAPFYHETPCGTKPTRTLDGPYNISVKIESVTKETTVPIGQQTLIEKSHQTQSYTSSDFGEI